MRMRKIITAFILLSIYPLQAVELDRSVSDYVDEACQNKLSAFCNKDIKLKKLLNIYAENFEGYMQSDADE